MERQGMDWLSEGISAPDEEVYRQARERQAQLTKPPGSLGLLEDVALRLAALQARPTPAVDRVRVTVFAADHGIAAENVSAFPQVVTTEMVRNFASGGAAINVLSRYVHSRLEVVDVGLIAPVESDAVVSDRAGCGTANFALGPAMTEAQLQSALNAGKAAIERAVSDNTELFIGGDMGIANTASASAIATVLLGVDAESMTGAGTGLDHARVAHKSRVIRAALEKHRAALVSPLGIMQYLGGFEIAALTGAYLRAAQRGLPVLVDGFIATTAALCSVRINPSALPWLFFSHCSHERGHRRLLQELNAEPLLDLSMRLGEGSGAAAAVPLLQMACRLHNEMATFAEAEITTK